MPFRWMNLLSRTKGSQQSIPVRMDANSAKIRVISFEDVKEELHVIRSVRMGVLLY